MKLGCQISTNTSGKPEDKIELKKFYQVIFLNKENNSICIYTGFVVEKIDLVINFSSTESNLITHRDITNKFCNEKNGWVSVWGEQGKIIDVENFKSSVPLFITEEDKNYLLVNNLHNNDLILISDNTKVFESLALKTELDQNPTNGNGFYSVNSKHRSKLNKVDFINWAKTEIVLPQTKLDWRRLEYNVAFSNEKDIRFVSDDFKIYFVLPEHYEIVSETGKSEQHFWKKNDKPEIEKNSFFKMKTDPSKYFEEWREEQNIEYRNYYKTTGFSALKETNKETRFEFEISSKRIKQTSNWIMTILVSLLIAFGLDHSRMSKPDVKSLFIIWPEILYLISVLLIVIAKLCLNNVSSNIIPDNCRLKKILNICHFIAVVSFFIWVFLIILISSNTLDYFINCTSKLIPGIFTPIIWSRICFGTICFFSILIIAMVFLKDKKIRKLTSALWRIVRGSKEYN